MDRHAEGITAEYEAGKYLESIGMRILDRNVSYSGIGEIDIVAKEGNTLVIVEVKYRSTKGYGHPLESVTKSKVRKIIKATECYLAESRPTYDALRFDIVSVLDGEAEHIPNAFYGYWH
ncbi:MAG: YraN family protein [Clostridia bacterium]